MGACSELETGKSEQVDLLAQIQGLDDQLERRNKLLFGEKIELRPKEKTKANKSKQTGDGPREQKELRDAT